MKNLILIILSFALVSCSTKPARSKPDNFNKIKQTHSEAGGFVDSAKGDIKELRSHIDVARGNLGRATVAHKYEGDAIKEARTKVNELLKVTPPELRAEVDAVDQRIATVEAKHIEAEFEFKTVEAAQEAANATAARAEAATFNASLRLTDVGGQILDAEKRDAEKTKLINSNADLAETEKKRGDKLSNIIGIVIAIGTAGAAISLVKFTVPWTFAIPPAAGAVAYLAARIIL